MKKNIFAVLLALIMFLIIILQYNANIKLKRRQGEIYEGNITYIYNSVKAAQSAITGEVLSEADLYMEYWKFNEFAVSKLPDDGILSPHFSIIRNEYNELLELQKGGGSQDKSAQIKKELGKNLSELEKAMEIIVKGCGDDKMKYFELSSENNAIMKDVKHLVEASLG